eukprot:1547212-Karenia_brevis.AAC.1
MPCGPEKSPALIWFSLALVRAQWRKISLLRLIALGLRNPARKSLHSLHVHSHLWHSSSPI